MLEDDPDISIVGEASDGNEAVEAVELLQAARGRDGLRAAQHERRGGHSPHSRSVSPKTAVLILSMHAEASYVRTCLEAGARGYLLKNAMDLELVSAVRKVAAGEQVLDPRLGKLAEADRSARPRSPRANSRCCN